MRFAIIATKTDPASMNIREHLLVDFTECGEFKGNTVYEKDNAKLYTIDDPSVTAEHLDEELEEDFLIFASKHQSKAGIPSLTVHAVGNWGEALIGGRAKTLSTAPAIYLKNGLKKLIELNEREQLGFDVIQEVTHHGPELIKPALFIEIGSSLEAWERKDAGKAIAEAILYLTQTEFKEEEIAIGLGGLHHMPKFTKLMLNNDIAFGHVCPKHALEFLDKDLLEQAMKKSNATKVFIEWKALAKEKQRIVSLLENIEYERI